VQPRPDPRRGLILAHLQHAAGGLGLAADAPPRNERTRECRIGEIERDRVVEQAPHSRWGVYLPFGEISQENSTGADTVTAKFTGQEDDAELGLYYYNARYYDPAIGRFLSADPVVPNPRNAQSFNRYSYVANNPVSHYDPSGNTEVDICSKEGQDEVCTYGGQPTNSDIDFAFPGGGFGGSIGWSITSDGWGFSNLIGPHYQRPGHQATPTDSPVPPPLGQIPADTNLSETITGPLSEWLKELAWPTVPREVGIKALAKIILKTESLSPFHWLAEAAEAGPAIGGFAKGVGRVSTRLVRAPVLGVVIDLLTSSPIASESEAVRRFEENLVLDELRVLREYASRDVSPGLWQLPSGIVVEQGFELSGKTRYVLGIPEGTIYFPISRTWLAAAPRWAGNRDTWHRYLVSGKGSSSAVSNNDYGIPTIAERPMVVPAKSADQRRLGYAPVTPLRIGYRFTRALDGDG
jgi:RHS repeat-associated protein